MYRTILLALLLVVGGTAAWADSPSQAITRVKRALRGDDIEETLAALGALESAAPRLTDSQARSAAVALRKALDEQDADVQPRMVRALTVIGGKNGWIPVVLASLEDREGAVKEAARKAVLRGRGDYVEVVQGMIEEESDPAFRARLVLLLGDRRRLDVVPVLLPLLAEEEHPRVQAAAAESLEAVTGKTFGFDAGSWTTWWNGEAAGLVAPGDAEPDAETVTGTGEREVTEPEPIVTRGLVPTFFDLNLTSKDIVFVIDISGSVGAQGVTRVKARLVEAVERLASDVNISALFFSEEVHMWKPEMVPATPENKSDLVLFLRSVRPGRRTDVFTPLNAGLQIVKRRTEALQAAGEPIREAIALIMVSDGQDTAGAIPPHVVEDKLSRLDPANTVVHAVTVGGSGSRLMAELARRGGGHYVIVP